MKVFQMTRFKKYVKKLPHHFQQVGPHENFYKNLKKYLKEIGE